MAATTISRATLNDDTGDGLSGDVWNAALIGTAIYDKIDALFTQAMEIDVSSDATPILKLVCSATAGPTMELKRTGGTASDWQVFLPIGTTDLEFYNALGGGVLILKATAGVNINSSTGTAMLDLIFNGAGDIDVFHARRTAGTTSDWELYMPTGSTDLRLYASGSGDRVVFQTAGHVIPGVDNQGNLGQTAGSNKRWKDILAVTKTSVLDVSWGEGRIYVAVSEGPEYRLQDQGSVRLDAAGKAHVSIDPKFAEVTTLALPFQVLTSGAVVGAKDASGFDLVGAPNALVDWLISATRAGFENVRWRNPSDPEPLGLHDPWEARTRKHPKNNTDKEPATARRAPADLPNFVAPTDVRPRHVEEPHA